MNPKHSADPPSPPYTVVSTRRHCVTRHSGCRQCVTDSVCHPGPRTSFCLPWRWGGGSQTLRCITWCYNFTLQLVDHHISSNITLHYLMLHPFVPFYITWRWLPTIYILPSVTKMKWTGWVRIGLGELLHYIIKLCYITAAGGSWVEQLNCDNGRWDLKSGSSVALPAVNGNRINWCFVIALWGS